MDKRFTTRTIKLEARKLEGLASVFYDPTDIGTEYDLGEGFVERIAPGAFAKSLGKDIPLLWQHDTSMPLARTPNTLKLWEDRDGLQFRAEMVDTSYGNDALKLIEAGVVRGCSFGFFPNSVEWKREGNKDVRYITDANLVEISLVTFPAYVSTECFVRERQKSNIEIYVQRLNTIIDA